MLLNLSPAGKHSVGSERKPVGASLHLPSFLSLPLFILHFFLACFPSSFSFSIISPASLARPIARSITPFTPPRFHTATHHPFISCYYQLQPRGLPRQISSTDSFICHLSGCCLSSVPFRVLSNPLLVPLSVCFLSPLAFPSLFLPPATLF